MILTGRMRLIPNIRYGTEHYPEQVARRLRATNVAAWIGASFVGYFAVWRFVEGKPHWKYAALVAVANAATPLLHRFGALAAPLAMVALAFVWTSWLTWRDPAGGTSFLYLAVGALGLLLVGTEHVVLSAAIGAVSAGLIIALEIMTGNIDTAHRMTFAVNVVGTSAVLYVLVFFAMRQMERAEANLGRALEEIQDKNRELAQASQHKSQFLANMSHELRTPLTPSSALPRCWSKTPRASAPRRLRSRCVA
jgi:adenylate cyclase